MILSDIAELGQANVHTVRAWWQRGILKELDGEDTPENGTPRQFGPRSAAAIIAICVLVRVGFRVEAAAQMTYATHD